MPSSSRDLHRAPPSRNHPVAGEGGEAGLRTSRTDAEKRGDCRRVAGRKGQLDRKVERFIRCRWRVRPGCWVLNLDPILLERHGGVAARGFVRLIRREGRDDRPTTNLVHDRMENAHSHILFLSNMVMEGPRRAAGPCRIRSPGVNGFVQFRWRFKTLAGCLGAKSAKGRRP
jgi:hypothetical protein